MKRFIVSCLNNWAQEEAKEIANQIQKWRRTTNTALFMPANYTLSVVDVDRPRKVRPKIRIPSLSIVIKKSTRAL